MSDEKKVLELSFEDRLKGVLYNYMTLFDQWKKQGEIDDQRSESFLKLLQALKEEVEGFSHLQSNVENSLKDMMKELTKLSIQHIKSSVMDSINNDMSAVKKQIADIGYQINHTISDNRKILSEAVQNACKTINSISTHQLIKTILTAIVGSVLASVITVKLLMPANIISFSNKSLDTYQKGLLLEEVWPRLSKEEQNKFLATTTNLIKEKRKSHSL